MKTWLITGCSSGIGKYIAKTVLEKGDNAIITARSTDRLQELVDLFPKTALPVALEVMNLESIKNAIKLAKKRFGTIDVLVNNAGRGYSGAIEEGDSQAVKELFDTNLFGPINLIKEVLPDMRLKKAGAIINISSLGVLTCDSGGGYYAASKAALEKISVALRKEVAPLGIKVMVVEPGPFRTNFRVSHVTGQNKNISEYASVKKARDKLALDPFGQKGDPQKAGKAIVAVIEKDDYPKTILLGKGISDIAVNILTEDIQEIKKWKEIGDATNFDE